MLPGDDPAYNELYGDIGGDQSTYLIISYLFLAGAAFGVFNLASRLVEAQRREIGISMALGVPNAAIAIRPLLIAVQIAILGLILGLSVGYPISQVFGQILKGMMPMPVSETPFLFWPFARAAIVGILLPFLAALYPVWRALRVTPVEAIQTGYLVAKGGRAGSTGEAYTPAWQQFYPNAGAQRAAFAAPLFPDADRDCRGDHPAGCHPGNGRFPERYDQQDQN